MRIPTGFKFAALGASGAFAEFYIPDMGVSLISSLVGPIAGVLTPRNDVLEKFWEEAQKLGPQAGHVVLGEISKVSSEVADTVLDFKNAIADVVQQAHQFRMEIQETIEKKGITIEHVFELLAREMVQVCEDLKDQVNEPLPEDRGEKAKARAKLIKTIMEKVRLAYIHVLTQVGLSYEKADALFRAFAPKVVHVLLIIGNITDKYPFIRELLVFAAAMLLLPEIQILRPILNLFGFGPLGPIKGSLAAWAQRTFFGGIIPAGSWFAILQKVGMTLAGSWLQKLAASAGLAAAFGFATED